MSLSELSDISGGGEGESEGGGHRRKPSYSEVLKSTPSSRPAPINTDVARAMKEAANTTGTGTTAPSAFWSASNTGPRTSYTPVTPLFSPSNSIWSPVHGPLSATIPHKASWEHVKQASASKVSPKEQSLAVQSPKASSPKQCFGSGLRIGDMVSKSNNDGDGDTTTSTAADSAAVKISEASEQPINPVLPTVRIHDAAKVSNGAAARSYCPGDRLFDATSISEDSIVSEVSEHPEAELRDAGRKAPMIAEEPHPRNFGRLQMDESVPMVDAFPGAFEVCSSINPSHYSMPYGSRVVCIKTDFVENIHWSVQTGTWAVMDKVAGRIMQLWDARVGKEDKVLLVYSINGQKSYCGLAEMAGPWKPSEDNFESFKGKKDNESRTWGTMPVTWIYCKNVSYNWFRDIKNNHSSGEIVNMWNGMHFPSEVARQVVELIISRPHFTNVICWREDGEYDPYKAVLNASQIDPLAADMKEGKDTQRMIENVRPDGRGKGRGTKNHVLDITNWRRPKETSLPTTTPPNLDGNDSPRPRKLVTCMIDELGNYVPVSPGGSMSKNPLASSGNSVINVRSSIKNGSTHATSAAHRDGGQVGTLAVQGSRRNVAGPIHAARVASSPHRVPTPQTLAGHVSPQIRRMKSDVGFEDPFGTPRTLKEANAMKSIVSKGLKASSSSNDMTFAFQRAASSANFVPQHSVARAARSVKNMVQGPPTLTVTQPDYSEHAPASGGGVSLSPPTPRPEDTPSRLPSQNHQAIQDMKALEDSPTVDLLQIEYLQRLSRQAAIDAELAGMLLKKARSGRDLRSSIGSDVAMGDMGTNEKVMQWGARVKDSVNEDSGSSHERSLADIKSLGSDMGYHF